jgi:hypothetical protein
MSRILPRLVALLALVPAAAFAVGINLTGNVSAPGPTGTVRSNYGFFNDPFVNNTSSGNYTLTIAPDGKSGQAEATSIISTSSAVSRARADLATGQLGIFASATGGGATGAYAAFNDRVFLPHSATGSPIPVHLDVLLEGSAVADDPFYFLTNSFLQVSYAINGSSNPVITRFPLAPGPYAVDFSVPTSPTSPQFSITANLLTNSGGSDTLTNGTADFYNTAAFSMSLPPGITYTSASGVFLTATPEPASLSAVLAPLASLISARPRRRRRR